MAETVRDMELFASYWNLEVPLRIHSRAVSEGGTPEWHHDFARWIGKTVPAIGELSPAEGLFAGRDNGDSRPLCFKEARSDRPTENGGRRRPAAR